MSELPEVLFCWVIKNRISRTKFSILNLWEHDGEKYDVPSAAESLWEENLSHTFFWHIQKELWKFFFASPRNCLLVRTYVKP